MDWSKQLIWFRICFAVFFIFSPQVKLYHTLSKHSWRTMWMTLVFNFTSWLVSYRNPTELSWCINNFQEDVCFYARINLFTPPHPTSVSSICSSHVYIANMQNNLLSHWEWDTHHYHLLAISILHCSGLLMAVEELLSFAIVSLRLINCNRLWDK